ncbi:glycoside hydrolase [Thozetella sp. PMI_491]|nr:glycoside hydrolase [Thozetella sp. PMI_491]
MRQSILFFLLQAAREARAAAAADAVGRLPALGWNSWNAFNIDIDEKKVITAAKKIVELGLKDAGYIYVNIDDGWSVKEGRHKKTGRLVPDPKKFPSGINGTTAKVHALGLKFGIYSSAGTHTCAGWPASLEHEEIDAETWAEWGVDYLKYDNCNVPYHWLDECDACSPDSDGGPGPYPNGTCKGLDGNWCEEDYDYTESRTAERFRRMRDALLAQDRPILYSLCEWGFQKVETWATDVGQSWRSSGDIFENWPRVMELLNRNSFKLNYVDFYSRSDPDMLEVGSKHLNLYETRSHFALWAAMKGPLLIGTDLAVIKPEHLAILKNEVLLAFNQDPKIGKPAMPYKWGTNPDWTWNASFPAEYWSGAFSNPKSGAVDTLVLVLNNYPKNGTRDVVWAEIPQLSSAKGATYEVTDVWTGKSLGCFKDHISVSIESHDTAVLVIADQCEPKDL